MSSAVRNSNTYCPTHLLGIPKSVCWRLSNQMRLWSPHHFTNKGTYMLLLHKRELNHLWKALKISNVLKSWDLSDVSIPYKRAKNPKSYTVNWEDFPANPDGKQPLAVLFMLWPVSWEKEACMTTWCAYLHLCLAPTPFQLFWAL